MKSKRNKFLSVFFLLSFFFSFGSNIAFSANFTSNQTKSLSKSHSHLNEKTIKADLSELLIEENENEDEVDFDLALHFLPFFLDLTALTSSVDHIEIKKPELLKTTTPIYIDTCNFRI